MPCQKQDHHRIISQEQPDDTSIKNERNTRTVVFLNIYIPVRAGENYRKICSCVRVVPYFLDHLGTFLTNSQENPSNICIYQLFVVILQRKIENTKLLCQHYLTYLVSALCFIRTTTSRYMCMLLRTKSTKLNSA